MSNPIEILRNRIAGNKDHLKFLAEMAAIYLIKNGILDINIDDNGDGRDKVSCMLRLLRRVNK